MHDLHSKMSWIWNEEKKSKVEFEKTCKDDLRKVKQNKI